MKWWLRIKQLREERHWIQQDIEERAGIKHSHYSRIELGHYQSLKDDVRIALARAFEMTPEAFSAYIYGFWKSSKIQWHRPHLWTWQAYKVLPIHIIGYINAGIPAPAEAIDLGNTYVEKDKISGVKNLEKVFGLRIRGDSLVGDKINNGDDVVIEPDPDLVEGKIYAVKIQGNSSPGTSTEKTLRHSYFIKR